MSQDDIIPGFIGWIQYGGNMLPGKVITCNKRKKTANIKFYDVSGLQTGRQTVNQGDMKPSFQVMKLLEQNFCGLNLNKRNLKKNIG